MPRRGDYREGVEIIDLRDEEIGYERQHNAPARRAAPYASRGTAPYASPGRQLAPPAPFHVRPAGEVRPARALCIARHPDSLASQQYRLMKYKLKEGLDPRIVGVTSPRPGEGKTIAAANFALALAEGRRVRTLLLDLNLRSPTLGALFGIVTPGSVGEQLRRKRRDPDAYWDVLELGSRLHLIAGNEPLESPAALLNSDEVGMLLADLAEHYDYVVVDLPAVLLAADVKIVQQQLDGLVLVCRAGATTRTTITSALAQLGDGKMQGVLMLDVSERYIPR